MRAACDEHDAFIRAEAIVQNGRLVGVFRFGDLVEFHRVADDDSWIVPHDAADPLSIFFCLNTYGIKLLEEGLEDERPFRVALAGFVRHAAVHERDLRAEAFRAADQIRPDFDFENHKHFRADGFQRSPHREVAVDGAVDQLDIFRKFRLRRMIRRARAAGEHEIVVRKTLLPFLDERQRGDRFADGHRVDPHGIRQSAQLRLLVRADEADALPIFLRHAAAFEDMHQIEREIQKKHQRKDNTVDELEKHALFLVCGKTSGDDHHGLVVRLRCVAGEFLHFI